MQKCCEGIPILKMERGEAVAFRFKYKKLKE
jgi:hypothetical protein